MKIRIRTHKRALHASRGGAPNPARVRGTLTLPVSHVREDLKRFKRIRKDVDELIKDDEKALATKKTPHEMRIEMEYEEQKKKRPHLPEEHLMDTVKYMVNLDEIGARDMGRLDRITTNRYNKRLQEGDVILKTKKGTITYPTPPGMTQKQFAKQLKLRLENYRRLG